MHVIALCIDKLRESGLSFVDIAKRVDFSVGYVSNVRKGVADPSCLFIMRLIAVVAERAKEVRDLATELEKLSKSNRSF